MAKSRPVAHLVRCQPNTTYYANSRQVVPYDKARQLETHYEKAWESISPPYVSSFTLADAEKKLDKTSAREVYSAVIDVRGRALPGNREASDQTALTYIHNIIGALFMTDAINGNQVTLLSIDFRDAHARTGNQARIEARKAFNGRAADYKVPIAMFVSSVPTPIEGLGNFEGVCFKAAVQR